MITCHSFSDSTDCTLRVPCGFPRVERVFGPEYYHLSGGALTIENMPEFEAFALLLA